MEDESLYEFPSELQVQFQNDALGTSPHQFGKPTWTMVHLHSLGYPNHPTETDKQAARNFCSGLVHLLGCFNCRIHAMQFLQQNPPRVDNKQEYFAWWVKFHNHANSQTGQPAWSVSKAFDYWSKYSPYQTNPLPLMPDDSVAPKGIVSTLSTVLSETVGLPSQAAVGNQDKSSSSPPSANNNHESLTNTPVEQTTLSKMKNSLVLGGFVFAMVTLVCILVFMLYKKRERLNPLQVLNPASHAFDHPQDTAHAKHVKDLFLRKPFHQDDEEHGLHLQAEEQEQEEEQEEATSTSHLDEPSLLPSRPRAEYMTYDSLMQQPSSFSSSMQTRRRKNPGRK